MVSVNIDSRISDFLEFFLGSQPEGEGLEPIELDHVDALASFADGFDHFNPTTLTASLIVLTEPVSGNTLTITGAGITPVSNMDALIEAIENGVANGSFSKIELAGTPTGGGAAVPLVTFDLTPTGYTLTSGGQVVTIGGATPTTLQQFSDIAELAEELEVFGDLSSADQQQVISRLNSYGITSLNLSDDGETLFAFSMSSSAFSLTVGGYEIAIAGTFPTSFGGIMTVIKDILIATDANTGFSSLNQVPGLALNSMSITDSEGTSLLSIVGPITDEASVENAVVRVDGVLVQNMIVADDSAFYFNDPSQAFADTVYGTVGSDHIFGLGGKDYLVGNGGNDFLYGGTDDDQLIGGMGNDYLNPGDNRFYDFVSGSFGNDTIDLGDMREGCLDLGYSAMSQRIVVNLNGSANTATVDKGANGLDTILDVNTPLSSGTQYNGVNIMATQYNDVFNVSSTDNGFLSMRGGEGADRYAIDLQGIVRLNFNHGNVGANTQGVAINLQTNSILNDGFGNAETLNLTDNGGVLEIRTSDFNDTVTGSDGDDRFILRAGTDSLDGGAGFDILRYDRSGVDHGVSADMLTGVATGIWYGNSFTHNFTNIEKIRGSKVGDDTLSGDNGANELGGRGGDDTLFGRGGDDTLYGEDGNDSLNGGDGHDTAFFNFDFDDAIISITGSVVTVVANGEVDFVSEVETFEFNDGARGLVDLITVDQSLDGGLTNDTLTGGTGNDRIVGGAGDDVLNGGDGADTLNGGDGDDIINGGSTSADLRDTVFAGAGNDTIDGGYGNDLIYGQDGDDHIAGGFGSDTLQGQGGNDVITGSALSDLVYGNDGNDFVNGGFGHDRIVGGSGADKFYHLGIKNHGGDWVQDFSDTEGDALVFGTAGATKDDFQINYANSVNPTSGVAAGDADIMEAFIIYKPRSQQAGDNGIVWGLVDGEGLDSLIIEVAGGASFDLLA